MTKKIDVQKVRQAKESIVKKTNNTLEAIQKLFDVAKALPATDYDTFTEALSALSTRLVSYENELLTLNKEVQDARFSRKQFSLLFEKAPIGFIILNSELRVLDANSVARGLINLPKGNLAEQAIKPLVVSHIVSGVANFIDWIQKESVEPLVIELHNINKKGQVKVWQSSYFIASQKYFILSIIPIAEEYALNRSLQLFKMVFEYSPQAIMIADTKSRIVDVNPAFKKITGYALEDVKNKDLRLLSSGKETREYFEEIRLQLLDEGYWEGVGYNKTQDGTVYPSEIQLVAAYDGLKSGGINYSEVTHYIGMFDNISERVEKEKALKVLSETDPLTDVYNRQGFNQQLGSIFQEAQREGHSFSLLFFDLDKFKYVNDRFGHDYGDELLRLMALRLVNNLKKTDIVSRLGGDEFVVILPKVSNSASLELVAYKLTKILAEPYKIIDIEHTTSASIGIASYPEDAIDKESLLKAADSAMYQAKSIRRGSYQFFNESVLKEYNAHQNMLEEVNEGIANNQFQLYYQPQHNMQTGELIGFEALVRWHYTEGEVRSPIEFLPHIENEQEMIKLGRQLINQAFITVNTWARTGFNWPVAINLSVIQLKQTETYDLIEKLCENYPSAAELIQIEITEVTVFENDPLIEKNLARLKSIGLDLVLDDFGTGYSSIYSLKKFQFDCIKIDKSFIDDIEDETNDSLVILNGMIRLIQELDIKLICEGVETQKQVDYLLSKGVKFAQGYFYNKPMKKIETYKYVELLSSFK